MAKPTVLPEWDTNDTNTIEPDSAHKADGWLAPAGVPEKPPFQTFNFLQKKYYDWLNEINIKGILGYDNLTDYIADLSYVVGNDGNLYQCGINNGPSSSVVNPVGDVTGTWNDIINVTPPTDRGYIDGLILLNAGVDTEHDIFVSEGICRDSTDVASINFKNGIRKQIDVNWADGSGVGGFPSGLTLLADTWYHFFVLTSADGTKIDAGFDTSLIATNLLADATDYSLYRRVGSVLTDGSDNILQFFQHGDEFTWKTLLMDIDIARTVADGALSITLRTPLGIKTLIQLNASVDDINSAIYLSDLDTDDLAPIVNSVALAASIYSGTGLALGFRSIKSNLVSQIRLRIGINNASEARVVTFGWIDPRGKDV